jgi:signal transduction histidine kinase
VLTLRSSTDGADSLGAAISGLARHLSAVSGVPIQVTLDEQTTRLRPEIEAELLRIVQESLNNAVKHAQASLIDVQCRVNPPEVSIVVADNGRGLQGRRVDSHGLEIMNERARLIGAELEVTNRTSGGAQVSVRIASGTGPSSPTVERGQEVLAT